MDRLRLILDRVEDSKVKKGDLIDLFDAFTQTYQELQWRYRSNKIIDQSIKVLSELQTSLGLSWVIEIVAFRPNSEEDVGMELIFTLNNIKFIYYKNYNGHTSLHFMIYSERWKCEYEIRPQIMKLPEELKGREIFIKHFDAIKKALDTIRML